MVLLTLINSCIGMKASKLFKFPKEAQYVYLAKFSLGEGNKAQFNFRAGFSSALEGDDINRMFTLHYVVVNDYHWPEFQKTDSWSRKLAVSNIIDYVNIKGDGYWSSYDTNEFENKYRTQIYYVAAMNWNGEFHATSPWLPKIWMEVKAFNGGEHFSQEEWGVLSMNFIMLISFIIFLGYSTYGYFQEVRKEEKWESPLAIIVLALTFEFIQILFDTIHLWVYQFDGEGIPTLDILSTIFQVISQVFIVSLILLIAFGWTVTYNDLPEKETIIMFTIMSVLIHATIAGLTALDKDEYHKYHDYSGVQGFMLVFIRIVVFIIFWIGIKMSSKDIKNKQMGFLRLFTVAGSFYILSFPILYIISYIWEPWVRNRVIVFGNFSIQDFSWVLLLYQLSSKDSKYKTAKIKHIIGN